MNIGRQDIFTEANKILLETYGPGAEFREGQYEAIEAAMTKKRVLVVQKTGWGKSLVYYICTKLNHREGRGCTMVISPLLILMENQMEMAGKMGLKCAALNSTVKDPAERKSILDRLAGDQLDMIFITPETLLKEETQERLPGIRIGLFVIDEAHCISDWGHEFRLDYGQIGKIVRNQFSNVAVLATTATANDRVVDDLKAQLGDSVYISRGPLTRESLHIQVLPLGTRTERYAWLLDNLNKIPGTGIIYCLDHRDCDHLTEFLSQNGIPVMSYYSDEKKEEQNAEAIAAFQENRIKAIVATIKLGMGYDKGDVSFVIHFQCPSNIVAWYQQIGRAGRNLKDAYVFLMTGREDDRINEYFIRTAFPTQKEMESVLEIINKTDGITKYQLYTKVNMRPARIDKAVDFLQNEGAVRREKAGGRQCLFPTVNRYVFRGDHYDQIRGIRHMEMQEMKDLVNTEGCLSRFAVNCLDDHEAGDCGKCANCTKQDILPNLSVSEESRTRAIRFVSTRLYEILPRKQYPDRSRIPENCLLQPGWCLSKYGDAGYGELVEQGKYPPAGMPKRFDDRLVIRAADVIIPWAKENGISHITCVPSLRSDLVMEYTRRLAQRTGLAFVDLLAKSEAPQQKTRENSTFQYENANNSFSVKDAPVPEKLILVDDVVDSKWTLTVCGIKLIEQGCREVYPFALADSSHLEE